MVELDVPAVLASYLPVLISTSPIDAIWSLKHWVWHWISYYWWESPVDITAVTNSP